MIKYGSLPFIEAIALLRKKINLPTPTWDTIWQDEHMRSFTVAGAMTDDIVADFREAVRKAQEDGTTLGTFRKDFDDIVKKYGWGYVGSRNWRSRLIYETNLKTLHAAGRWRQMTDPDVMRSRPYLVYRHGVSAIPRPEHLAWDGLTLLATDPWWDTHYPPNGWGCSCFVLTASQRELDNQKKKLDTAPEIKYYEWTSPHTGKTHQVPVGIDPGWAYNAGQVTDREMVNV